jgi:uncharacterized protein (DUF983 family)
MAEPKKGIFSPNMDEHDLAQARRRNNPNNAPTGPFTGRCPHCGSKDLWDDNLAYGCNSCKALLGTN